MQSDPLPVDRIVTFGSWDEFAIGTRRKHDRAEHWGRGRQGGFHANIGSIQYAKTPGFLHRCSKVFPLILSVYGVQNCNN
jgi:hypothetical protein